MSGVSKVFDLDSQDINKLKILLNEVKHLKYESSKARQVRDIVDIETWLEDPYYSGPDNYKIYPYWKEALKQIFQPDANYTEIILAGCQNENTRIPTSIGILSYKELKERFDKGERFTVTSEEGENQCTNVFYTGYNDTYKIRFNDGSIVEGTKEHRVRVIRNGELTWAYYNQIQVGDRILKSTKPTVLGSKRLRPNEAYFLGYLTGDGCVSKDKNAIKICIGDYVKYKNAMDALVPIMEYISPTNHVGVDKSHKSKNALGLIIHSKEYRNYLVDNNIGFGAKNKRVPNFIFECCKEDICDYLAGLFDSDGYIGGCPTLSSCSIELLRDVQLLLSSLGIRSHIKGYCKDKESTSRAKVLIIPWYMNKRFYDSIHLKIDYKREKLEEYLGDSRLPQDSKIDGIYEEVMRLSELDKTRYRRYHPERFKTTGIHNLKRSNINVVNEVYDRCPRIFEDSPLLTYLRDHQVYDVEVVDVELTKCRTMDMTVENSPTYLFNGFISHNSIGTGKSTVALYGIVRKLYELSCYENVQGLYGLMGNSSLAFAYFSLNLKQAQATGFGQITNLLDSIPYFQKEFPRASNRTAELDYPMNIYLKPASNNNHVIGSNLIGSILDEANFHQGESTSANSIQEISKVENLYASIQARARSRFIYGGKVHSLSFLVSSSTHKGSITERRLEEARKDGFKHTLYFAPKLWDVKSDRYSKERFYVYTGSDVMDAFIIQGEADFRLIFNSVGMDVSKRNLEELQKMSLTLPDDLVISVPIDFRPDFETNIEKAIQDIGGVSTSPTGRLFSSRPIYDEVIGTKLKHPFMKEQITISTGSPDIGIEDFLDKDYIFPDSHKPHWLHIDASIKGDSMGLAMTHVDSFIEDATGARSPIFVTDIQLRINPPKAPHEIPLAKIRQFICYLRDVLNINILGVSYDKAHSSESMQLLRDSGFICDYISVDRTDEAYINFCSLIYEKRIIDYKYSPFEEEFFSLIHYKEKRKVDHLPGFKKDVSDAKVGSIQGLINHLDEIPSDLDISLQLDSDFDKDELYMDLIDEDDLYVYSEFNMDNDFGNIYI